jgi:hypothetical protein
MTVSVADAYAQVQGIFSIVKTATVLEEYNTKEQTSVVRFLWAKGLSAMDIRKEIFHVYG